MVFTEILNNFVKILEKLPGNLKSMCMTLLYFLSTIDIALTVYKNINNPDFNYVNWAKTKILKIGFIIFAIKSYEWFLSMVKSFFLSVGTKGLGISLNGNNYFNDPSVIWDKGREIGDLILDEVSGWPSTYVFILLGIITYIGFFMLSIQIIICWVEYYFLTGISIIFLPFGALDLGLEYYKNVFKTIMSCSIKLCVFNIWLLICDKLIKELLVVNRGYELDDALVVCGTVYILVVIMLSMPSLTSGLLTGSPTMNAGAAMAGATGAVAGMTRGMGHVYRGTKETVKGAVKGAKIGASGGSRFLGGPGTGLGIVGSTVGGIGGAIVGGSYAGARYGVFKEKAKDKQNNGNNASVTSPSNNSSLGGNSSGGNTSQAGSANSNGGSSGSTPNQQSTTSNSPGNNGGTPSGSGQAPSSNIQGATGSVNTNAQTQVNAPNSNGDTTTQPSSSTNDATTVDNSNIDSTQATGTAQSSTTNTTTQPSSNTNDTTTTDNSNIDSTQATGTAQSNATNMDTSTVTNVSNSTSSDSGNNVDNSNNTNSSTNTSSTTSSDTGSNSEKRGIKVNGGEAGKLPDWMEGDY
ncbi:type IV secretion system protein [Fusobacterium hwasookii]|uniref:type IV secretion system protein n=2 Tax=Fusobacterium hwasookii TaxID=1583098 RepID=UPI00071AEED7|nr:type IV secretion system protein [Fusobacterium hwasookii]ALQ37866.1 conjugal transfer protein TrbL [Fusobacterium hwasookii ChDC F300]